MRYLIHTDGTYGDLLPFIFLAEKLVLKGHEVSFYTNEYYKSEIESKNIDFYQTTNLKDREEFLSNPNLWQPLKSLKVLGKAATNIFMKAYPEMEKEINEIDIIISYSFTYAGKTLAEKYNKPYVSLNISPIQIKSIYRTPTLPFNINSNIMPRFFKKYFFWQVGDFLIDKKFPKDINNFRNKINLKPIKGFVHWANKADLAIGLWSEKHCPKELDQDYLVNTNFPKKVETIKTKNIDLENWINNNSDNDNQKPILITMGSGYLFSESLLKIIKEISKENNQRFIFIDAKSNKDTYSDEIAVLNKICLSEYLPKCLGIIYHGGAGTLAQAVYAGIPQIILPMSHDQPDNAKLIQKHKLGEIIWSKPNKTNLNNKIKEVFHNQNYINNSQEYMKYHKSLDCGIDMAVDEIINFISRKV